MFRRLRYKKWLVTGVCVTAVVIPSAALAGNNGRSADTTGVVLSAGSQHSLDPAIVKYLLRYGFTQGRIAAMSGGTYQAPSLDPAIVKYLLRYGFTQGQIAAMSGGTYQARSLDPAIVKYLLRYGFTQGQIAAMSGGTYQAPNEPVATSVREPSFQWDNLGIGLSAAVLALVALSLWRLFSNRGGRRPATSS